MSVGGAGAVEGTGRRVEEALDRLAAEGSPAASAAAEQLVRALMDFYGAGLARIMELLPADEAGPAAALLADEVVTGLLVLHGLHPEDTGARIGRGLRAAQADTFAVEEFDEDSGVLLLAEQAAEEEGGGCGCPSTGEATKERVERALACYAPEVTVVELRQPAPQPALLQIGRRPTEAAHAGAAPGRGAGAG